MTAKTFRFETHHGHELTLIAFADVSNAGELHQQMISGGLPFEASFINAALVPDVAPVLASAAKALVAESRGKLTTKTLWSELVFNLAGSKHISASLSKWGISSNTAHLLVACFNASPEMMCAVRSSVKGTEVSLATLGERADMALLKKSYKIADKELQIGSVTDAILTRIAVRDCT